MVAKGYFGLPNTAEADIDTPASGYVNVFNDSNASNTPAYKDSAGAVHSFVGADGVLTYLDHGNTGSTETITVSAGNVQRLVGNAATITITLAGWAASGTFDVVRCLLVQDSTGGRVWSWPAAVTWGAAGEPGWASRAANAVDIVDLESVDGGTTVYATLVGRQGPPSGGAVSIEYTFSTTTTDADPGAGILRLSSATQNTSTVIRADLLDVYGATRTTTIDALDDSTNTVKGHLRLFKTTDPTKWILFTLTSIASPSGYRNLTVVPIDSSAASPFAASDPLTLSFVRAGDAGASGTAQVATDPIFDAKGDLPVGTGADTSAKLTVGANGTRPEAASGQTTGIQWSYPPGYEFATGTVTSNVSMTRTGNSTTANTDLVVAAGAYTANGTDTVKVTFSAPWWNPDTTSAGIFVALYLFDDSGASLGRIALKAGQVAGVNSHDVCKAESQTITPASGSRTYSIRGGVTAGTGTVGAGAGGSGNDAPGIIRVIKVG